MHDHIVGLLKLTMPLENPSLAYMPQLDQWLAGNMPSHHTKP